MVSAQKTWIHNNYINLVKFAIPGGVVTWVSDGRWSEGICVCQDYGTDSTLYH